MHNFGFDLRQLRAFVTVASELNFLRAAHLLHVSQPTLSQTIRQLEGTLGVSLFNRNTRSVALTEAGEELVKDAKKILDYAQKFIENADDHVRGIRGVLNVGFLTGTGVDLMPEVLRAFGEKYPEVRVLVKEFDFSKPEAGINEGMDVAILRPPVSTEGVELEILLEETCVACLPQAHRLAKAANLSIYDLLDEPIVAAPSQGIWRNYWIADDYRGGRGAKVVHEAATVESELQAVASGRGISITALSTALFYSRPGVVFPPIRDMPPCRIAVALPQTATKAARNFADIAVNVAEAHRAREAVSPAGHRASQRANPSIQ
ncbi:LysR family transcriptional regulator [Paraburkholderia megapolitana]|uniref:DNA-binding transcriptional regulator, LysR family n=1 Tax=Paraburkholderia megapolitana TaxID=420953 RepID=A0A1I3N7F3_9BURK|nr:LysR family transcriptional regulator [Paraburkholderia megapolitana]QDQ84274.1 LysR family transcriptional regulator [Paraburkholderia megapolitana]SFJ05167.1 DNA-binding transcriptional regulator, LysR family [Paraburkholderia megapolitana]